MYNGHLCHTIDRDDVLFGEYLAFCGGCVSLPVQLRGRVVVEDNRNSTMVWHEDGVGILDCNYLDMYLCRHILINN